MIVRQLPETAPLEKCLTVAGSCYLPAELWEIAIDSVRCPLTFAEFTLKEFERDNTSNQDEWPAPRLTYQKPSSPLRQ